MHRFSLLLLLLVAGCGVDEGPAATAASFEGTPWILVSGVDVRGWEAVAPSASFDGRRLSGFSGCNRYSTRLSVNGPALELGGVVATRMACGPTASAVEGAFTAGLERAAGWRIDGEALVLLDGHGHEVLRFEAASPIGTWEADSFAQSHGVSSLLEGTEITASFGDDGQLSGWAGCNRYTARFTRSGGAIEIGALAVTRMACDSPAGVLEQEAAYLEALLRSASYRAEGSTLTLLTSTGTTVATYTRTG